MNMNINGLNNFGVMNQTRPTEQAPPQTPNTPPQLSDTVDFTDGANNAVEMALLPSVDFVLGQASSQAIESGQIVKVEGELTKTDAPGQEPKKLGKMNYEMKANFNKTELETTGYLLTDVENEKGTFIKEKSRQNPQNPMTMNVKGTIDTDKNSELQNEELAITVGLGSFAQQGKVNGFDINQQMGLDVWGNVHMQGYVAGTPYKRSLYADYQTGGTKIQGQFGNMQETGEAKILEGGGFQVERQIGPYHLSQKITFVNPPQPENPETPQNPETPNNPQQG